MITSKPILLKFERSYFKFIKYDIYCDTHSKLRDRGLFYYLLFSSTILFVVLLLLLHRLFFFFLAMAANNDRFLEIVVNSPGTFMQHWQ